MIPQEYKNFGLVDIPRDRTSCFRLWSSPYESHIIWTSGQPIHAQWSGNSVIVEMQDGTKRIYHSLSDSGFQIMYS
jgi:hypothetical protein